MGGHTNDPSKMRDPLECPSCGRWCEGDDGLNRHLRACVTLKMSLQEQLPAPTPVEVEQLVRPPEDCRHTAAAKKLKKALFCDEIKDTIALDFAHLQYKDRVARVHLDRLKANLSKWLALTANALVEALIHGGECVSDVETTVREHLHWLRGAGISRRISRRGNYPRHPRF